MKKFNFCHFHRHLKQCLFTVSLLVFCNGAAAETLAGKTIIASGEVKAADQNKVRQLSRRSPVYKVDLVSTAPDSQAQFKMIDGGILALQANTQLEIASYQYDQKSNTGSAVMNLLSGGLRTISGKIKSYNGNYQLNTPVGSIGVRGTHYEVEIVGDEMFLAVWDGAIDFTSSKTQQVSSFGDGEHFNFAKIEQSSGKVTGLLEVPAVFDKGHSIASNQTPAVQPEIAINAKNSVKIKTIDPAKPKLISNQNEIAVEPNQAVTTEDELTIKLDQYIVDNFLSFKDEAGQWHNKFGQAINRAELDLAANLNQPNHQSRFEIEREAFPHVSAGGAFEFTP